MLFFLAEDGAINHPSRINLSTSTGAEFLTHKYVFSDLCLTIAFDESVLLLIFLAVATATGVAVDIILVSP